MLKITTDKVYLTRGDSADINIVIKDSSGTVYELQSGDALTFTMKNNCETEDIVCQKDCTATEQINLTPSDTDTLAYGVYFFDVQLTTAGGKVYTVIPPHEIIICKEVTFNEP